MSDQRAMSRLKPTSFGAADGPVGAMDSLAKNCMVEDATVPSSYLPEIIQKVNVIGRKIQVRRVLAHAGYGNLHPTSCRHDVKDEMAMVDQAMDEFMQAGGAVAHAVRRTRKAFQKPVDELEYHPRHWNHAGIIESL